MKEVTEKKIEKGSVMRMLPNVITIASFCFGLTAIRFGLFQKWEIAVSCILISALLDSLDGRVARMIGQSSQFGAELDSLSDLVCFGVAPALLLFLRSMYRMDGLGWGVCMFFAVCCAFRLARFNAVQILNEPQPDWMKKYFTGVPAPAGAVIALFPMILYFSLENEVFLNPLFIFICVLFSGLMMISRIRSFSSKMIEFKEGFASPELVIISLIIICLITAPWTTLSVLTTAYLLTIPYGAYCYNRKKIADDKDQAQKKSNTKKI
ncbi:MAG: CDP-diacylglycerol--serine O-phosphatidyltransferase [Alphaproteobacteria bacterium]|nr:CDP-diacylglycerol--serine O-phosphatidyltransferase [Alphaproteobacteria bacterium]